MSRGIYIRTEKTKKKMRERMLGNQYTKGKKLSKEEYERIWTDEHKEKARERAKGNQNVRGKHWKVKDTSKNREAKMGNQYAKGYHHTDEAKEKNRKWHIEHPNKKFSNTLIEQKIVIELDKRGFVKNRDYYQNIGLSKIANVDFYLPEFRVVIECDGDYWHNRLDTKKEDKEKNELFKKNRYKVYRFWEHEINKSAENCINTIDELKRLKRITRRK